MERQIIAIFGNCQAFYMSKLCNALPSLVDRFKFVHFSAMPESMFEGEIVSAEDVANIRYAWVQRGVNEGHLKPEAVADRIAPNVSRLYFPPLVMLTLWPFARDDSGRRPEPGLPEGRFPWGDRIAAEVAKNGMSPPVSVRAYMRASRAEMPHLERYRERDFAWIAVRDRNCDVGIADYIAERWKSDYLFWTWGHPAYGLLSELICRVIDAAYDAVGISSAAIRSEIDLHLGNDGGIGGVQLPIHPDVIETFGLSFVKPDTRYGNRDGNWWTFEEYLLHYFEWERT